MEEREMEEREMEMEVLMTWGVFGDDIRFEVLD